MTDGAKLNRVLLKLSGEVLSTGPSGKSIDPDMVKAISEDLLTVTPGIRLETSDAQDQKRVSTPTGALSAGADLLVIGRPITSQSAPRPIASAGVATRL